MSDTSTTPITEATARELVTALRENAAATLRAAIANEGVMQVLRESAEEEQEPEQAPLTYMDGTPR